MKLTSKDAKKLVEQDRGKSQDRRINHCLCVGDTAGRIATALKEKGYDIDVDKTMALGYIHDIGYRFEKKYVDVFFHAIEGYKYLKSLGYDEEYAGICIKHSFLNHDIDCLAGDGDETDKTNKHYDFVKNYIQSEYSLSEKVINLCDLMCTDKVTTMEKRIIDILIRHGAYKNTQYHLIESFKLKQYFDDLLGFNLYTLFPEIIQNL